MISAVIPHNAPSVNLLAILWLYSSAVDIYAASVIQQLLKWARDLKFCADKSLSLHKGLSCVNYIESNRPAHAPLPGAPC